MEKITTDMLWRRWAAFGLVLSALTSAQGAAYVPEPRKVTSDYTVACLCYPGWATQRNGYSPFADARDFPERTPIQGYYDEADPEVYDWQVKWATEHGINCFVFCWYRLKENEGRPVTAANLRLGHVYPAMERSRYGKTMDFALLWECDNAGSVADVRDFTDNLVPFWVENYFRKPNYLKIGNRPVVFVYDFSFQLMDRLGGPEKLKAAFAAASAKAREYGFDGLHFTAENRHEDVGELTKLKAAGYEQCYSYCWQVLGGKPTQEEGIACQVRGNRHHAAFDPNFALVTCSCGWDSYPWDRKKPSLPWWASTWKLTPENWRKALAEGKRIVDALPKSAVGRRLILLDNWNEWCEGHYIAPHRAGGFEYLKAVREVFTKCDNEPDYRLPKDVGLGPYDRGIDWSATKERKAFGPPGWTPEGAFLRPPKVARPGVWWHWMGAQVTEEGIARDLDWFVRMGITSATVFGMADSCTPWAKRIGNVPTEGLRPFDGRWWRLFAFACREGKRRGIDIGLHNCPGYTSTGGPWIPSRLAMRELVFDVTNAAVQVSTKPNAIFPVYNEDAGRFELPPCPARQTDVVEIGVARGGVRVAHVPMGAFVQPADWDSFGLECDKMNPEAVDFHLDHVIGELKRHLGDDLPAAGLGHVLLDSYEAGTPTWTPRMREEFRARRGYDPLEFLPILGGRTNLYTAAEIERFSRDFDRTLRDLYRDVLFKRMSERLRTEGLAFANEPYEGPFEPSEVAPYVDRIMTEFWYDPKGSGISKAHQAFNRLTNRFGNRHNVVEAEAFTGAPEKCAWTEMPANIKPSADDAFLGGVNRLILHTNPLQPWGDDVVPGVTMGRWGVHFGRTQTWAESGKAWFDYLARCQSLLQWGEPSDARLDVPFAQLARTDGARTLWFVVNKTGRAAALGLSGRWYDPVTGEIGVPPRTLAAGQSGFYERDGKAKAPADAEAAEERPLSFDPAVGDRSKSADPAVRYHSGTVRYRAVFDAAVSGASPVLDLRNGYEQVFAVRLNGKCVGTVWCAPWEIRLPAKDLRAKGNVLEIDVTNAWRNRLVGDEQEPEDCEFAKAPFGPGAYLVRYPDWFAKGMGARPSAGRRCFVTWNSLDRASSLLPSGLVETPVLRDGLPESAK